jgi:hypothetical protein
MNFPFYNSVLMHILLNPKFLIVSLLSMTTLFGSICNHLILILIWQMLPIHPFDIILNHNVPLTLIVTYLFSLHKSFHYKPCFIPLHIPFGVTFRLVDPYAAYCFGSIRNFLLLNILMCSLWSHNLSCKPITAYWFDSIRNFF